MKVGFCGVMKYRPAFFFLFFLSDANTLTPLDLSLSCTRSNLHILLTLIDSASSFFPFISDRSDFAFCLCFIINIDEFCFHLETLAVITQHGLHMRRNRFFLGGGGCRASEREPVLIVLLLFQVSVMRLDTGHRRRCVCAREHHPASRA